MDRRQFLKLFTAAALASIAPLELLAGFSNNKFYSSALNFSFDMPRKWYRPTINEVRENLQKQTFTDDYCEEDALAPSPLIAFYRYREPHVGMNPGIWVYADKIQPFMETPYELAEAYLEYFSSIVEDARCLKPPTETRFGGVNAIKLSLAYHAVVEEDNFEHDVVDYSRILFHRGNVIWFLYEHSFDGTECANEEFQLVDNSIVFS